MLPAVPAVPAVPALSDVVTTEDPTETFPVWLHVYDLTDGFHLPILNSALLAAGAGLFHAGVEVHGNEFSFGMTRHCGTGIYLCEPKSNTGHSYRESILLGYTSISRKELRKLTKEMKKEWMGPSYRLISKNCIHFSSAFSQRLGVAEVPRWVFGMATLAKELVDGIASSGEALTRAVSFTDCNGRQVLDDEKSYWAPLWSWEIDPIELAIGKLERQQKAIDVALVPLPAELEERLCGLLERLAGKRQA
eukprot:s138_g17.t1